MRVNYNYCFMRDKLYLYWPEEYNVKMEIRRKLLGLRYQPNIANFMMKLEYNQGEKNYNMELMKWSNSGEELPMLPKRGCRSI